MLRYNRAILDNGLKMIVNEDKSTPLVALNILYNAGSKYEMKNATGIAHMAEHLMFSGTDLISDPDNYIQSAGGEMNAFTNNDIAVYYITIPVNNIETALWIESNRMQGIKMNDEKLAREKNVVAEEYKLRFLNVPYGDSHHLLRNLAYKKHPYRWPAIGNDISHITSMKENDVVDFFRVHYSASNAIVSLSGNISEKRGMELISKWFSGIAPGSNHIKEPLPEPEQKKARRLSVDRKVPSAAIYKAWHVCKRTDTDFYTLDLLTDLLAGGVSGRLNEVLVREKRLFSDADIHLTSDIESGLMIFSGKLMKGVTTEEGEEAIESELSKLIMENINPAEIEKVKNKYEANAHFGNISLLNRAFNLAYCELLGNIDLVNTETEIYRNISAERVKEAAGNYFKKEKSSTIIYNPVKKKNTK